ncbi:MAG: hypothetical protein OEM62_12535, partial [Acidobacteriota bacterium]|nr:hypothetical protein [Acidobacteriota bacterium]
LALGLGDNREPTGPMDRLFASRWSAAAGGVLLGLSVSMRYPNLLLAIALPIALALTGRRSRALAAAVSIVATLAGGLALNQLLTGAAVPYKAVRATFNEETGYPAGEGAEERLSHFQTAQATHRLGVVPQVQPAVTFYSTLYFFVGRHTGILLYGPAALVFAWLVVFGHRHAQRDLVGLTLVAAVVALAAFYLLWMPRNYFGGATFLGNRYFLTGYVLLLLAPQRAPGRRALASVWVIAGLTFFSAATSSARTWDTDGTSQMHASVGIFRLFPYESTAMDLDGRRDRYWSDELVRFVDPFAKVGAQGFKLSAGSPAAELVTACSREHGVIRLLVQSDVPEVEVVYRDWLQKKRFRLKSASGGARGFLEIVPSPTVRRHSYWWDSDASLAVRSFRLSLRTPDGGPADAEVRYAGPYRFVPRFYRAETESARIPGHGRAASLRRLALRVRNVGSRYWETDDPIPILVGYRLFRLPRTESEPVAIGPFSPLPRRIAPGEVLEMELEAAWPEEEGRYELVVDLVVAGLNWFEEWNGAPVAHRPIRVVTAADEGT